MSSQKTLGILGGGQLGRLLLSASQNLLIPTLILDPSPTCPASQLLPSPSQHIVKPFTDAAAIMELAERGADVLTVEIEHVDVGALRGVMERYDGLEGRRKVEVHPDPGTIEVIQDKYKQKVFLRDAGCALGEFVEIPSGQKEEDAVKEATEGLGLPLMLKAKRLAYDGRGNYLLRSSEPSAISTALSTLRGGTQKDLEIYAEKFVPFKAELAVMVVRSTTGQVKSYPCVETVQRDNICHLVWAPYPDSSAGDRARDVAEKAVAALGGAGIFGVEMFLLEDGSVLLNEIAPRPHNSGHYTLSIAPGASQFENHLRAVLGLPLGSTEIGEGCTAMINLVGSSSSSTSNAGSDSTSTTSNTLATPSLDTALSAQTTRALQTPGASVYLYGKAECRKGRKMGHVNVSGPSRGEVEGRVKFILGEASDATQSSSSEERAGAREGSKAAKKPLVGIVMGSDSDLPTMRGAAEVLKEFGVECEVTIVSAHRTTDRLVEYARSASPRGLHTIIAGAGGAAHLPGMLASITPLPVIGVPINNAVGGSGGGLGGVDALYSIVQMPKGIPVATVAINNSANAGLLAIRILSAVVPRLRGEMEDYMKRMERVVLGKVRRLEEVGWEGY